MPSRSEIMRAVKSKHTAPELALRRLIHRMGYRYCLHRQELPGTPDMVFFSRKKVIFLHGCFWHGHMCKRGDRLPRANQKYWAKKIQRNRERDNEQLLSLAELGWQTLVVWECELRDPEAVRQMAQDFLGQKLRTRPEQD